jgi:ectoine hydroxylase-related dioxygenase (phytanoyl-CoA dioxygenase family)
LVTMPNATEWRVPHKIWHSDFQPTLPTDHLAVVKVWALFGDVAPGGAGTPQLCGSHRAFARYVETTGETDYKRAKFGFLKSHPWLRALSTDDGSPDRNATFMTPTDVDGVPMHVMECTGNAGDLYITHPWTFHTIATNATPTPRLMRSFPIWSDVSRQATHAASRVLVDRLPQVWESYIFTEESLGLGGREQRRLKCAT